MFVYVITAPINRVFYCCVKSRDNNHRDSKGTLGCLWSEISHHNSLAHTQRAIALYLISTWPFFLGDPIPTGSKNECELRKKKKSALCFGFSHAGNSTVDNHFYESCLSQSSIVGTYMWSQGAISAGGGTAPVLLSKPGTMASLFPGAFSSII